MENEQHISLSSHTVSVRTSNLPKDFPHFTITPLMTPLCQAIDVFYNALIADAQYTLFVGSEVTPRQAIMKKFMRGLVLDYNTGLFKVGLLSPVIFNKTYEPVEYLSSPTILTESYIIESVYAKDSKASKQNRFFAVLSEFIMSGNAEYIGNKYYRSNTSFKTRNAVASLLFKKTQLFIEENKIDLNPSFIDQLYSIVDDKKSSRYNRTKSVVKLLNRYGWYVPSKFTLGGRVDLFKPLNESSASYERNELEDLEKKLRVAYIKTMGNFSKEASISVKAASGIFPNEHFTSTVEGAIDIPSFMQNVEFKENWRIIALDNIVPTCKLLLRDHSNLFAEIRRLIIQKGQTPSIQNLQPHINMIQYVNNIWDEYVQPF